MIREYLKLARSFNAVLTGISPVMGAIAMGYFDLFLLTLLFIIGFFGHTFGFVFNDIIDYNIDKSSKEISDRPLISGTISLKNAWIFALASMIISFGVAFYLAFIEQTLLPILFLAGSAFFITLYDLISKKFPFMDFLVGLGIFFFILYGSSIKSTTITDITLLAWIVCILGSIQVVFMQIVAGGLKDIQNDFEHGAKTTAVTLGVRVTKDRILIVPIGFQIIAYGIQIIDISLVILSFYLIDSLQSSLWINGFQWIVLGIIFVMMMLLSYRLIHLKTFDRKKARTFIGTHYMINFALVPVMLMSINLWTGVLMFFPFIGFILSNLILHGTLFQPKTM
jgi:4-hydroxybenzoate polyprenyltransferase